MYIGNKIVFNKCSIYRPALAAEHLQVCVSSKPINFLNASCFRRISGTKFRTSSKTMQDDVSVEPHSHACDFADVRRSRLQQRQNLKLLNILWERRKLQCIMNDAASPWSRFGKGDAGSSKSSLLLPPPPRTCNLSDVTSYASASVFLPHITGHMS